MTDPYRSARYGWYAMALFAAVQTCNMIDRSVISLVLEPMGREFGLSDHELGGLTGLAFGLTYMLGSLVYATFIDRIVRRNFLAAMVAAWSACTALCGLAPNAMLFALAQLGLGGFEAGGSPTMMSMIPDIIERERRSTAMGIFFLSATAGIVVTFFLGGYIVERFGWRSVFFIAAVPGFLLVPVILLTLREPVRGAKDAQDGEPVPASGGLGQAAANFLVLPNIGLLLAGMAISTTAASAVGTWIASFFIRAHGLPLTTIGIAVAIALGCLGSAGSAIWGTLGDRLAERDGRWRLNLSALALGLAALSGIAMAAAPSSMLALLCFGFYGFFAIAYMPPVYAVFATLVPPNVRGATMFLMSIATTSLGYGVGPWLCGALSDAFGGTGSLNRAFIVILMCDFVAVALFMRVNGRLHPTGASKSAGKRSNAPANRTQAGRTPGGIT